MAGWEPCTCGHDYFEHDAEGCVICTCDSFTPVGGDPDADPPEGLEPEGEIVLMEWGWALEGVMAAYGMAMLVANVRRWWRLRRLRQAWPYTFGNKNPGYRWPLQGGVVRFEACRIIGGDREL